MAKMALEGIRVGDWSIAAAGPSTSMWLGMFGAEVIKIEAREGDMIRQPTPGAPGRRRMYGVSMEGVKVRPFWEVFNSNKKSLTVNLKKERGREIIYRLAKTLDVFSHNQLPDTAQKLGMDFETLRGYNPRLIYASGTVFGPKGSRRLVPASDVHGQAVSGLLTTSGHLGDPLMWATPGISDFAQGFSVASGIFLALYHRERSGEAQRVDGSQLQAGMNIYHLAMLGIQLFLPEERRQKDPNYNDGNYAEYRWDRREASPTHTYYQCQDKRWVLIGAQGDKHWKALCEALGEPELVGDARFSNAEQRQENKAELFATMERLLASGTLAQWEERFNGKDCSFTPVHRMRDLPTEPQVLANDYLHTFEHPLLGKQLYPGDPFTLSKTPGSIRKAAPGLGEHTDEILMELGYSAEEVVELHEQEVV